MNGIPLPDCQVLVVGAGPTGLVLAAELLARGINVRIIDKGDGMALQSRAIGIHARTLEALDMMGLAERFIEHGQVVRHLNFFPSGLTSFRAPRLQLQVRLWLDSGKRSRWLRRGGSRGHDRMQWVPISRKKERGGPAQ
jgi:2-polyprenyl-6-methoxyphenol hydroxylase-like FAD-dependent oxidoreductase